MKKLLLIFSVSLGLAFSTTFGLSFEELKIETDKILENSSDYTNTLHQLYTNLINCSELTGNASAPICKDWIENSYPKYLEHLPVDREELQLSQQDIQLKKLKTQLIKKRFRFSRGDGGGVCPDTGMLWLDLWEVTIPKYKFKTQFRYFNPQKNPKTIRTTPNCDFSEYFSKIIPLQNWQWLYNNSIRIPSWNAITPEFFEFAYIEFGAPYLNHSSSRREIKSTYLNVYKQLFQISNLKDIQNYFDKKISLAHNKRLESHRESQKNQLFGLNTLPPMRESIANDLITGNLYNKYAVDLQQVYTYCYEQKDHRKCEKNLDTYWGDLIMYWTQLHPYWDEKDPQKIKVLILYSPSSQITFL